MTRRRPGRCKAPRQRLMLAVALLALLEAQTTVQVRLVGRRVPLKEAT